MDQPLRPRWCLPLLRRQQAHRSFNTLSKHQGGEISEAGEGRPWLKQMVAGGVRSRFAEHG